MGAGDDDAEVAKYAKLDPNSEIQVKEVIRDRLIPAFQKLPVQKRNSLLLEMREHLKNPHADFKGLLASALLPFGFPSEPVLFFVWLSEEMQRVK
jgi:hypothetical protein